MQSSLCVLILLVSIGSCFGAEWRVVFEDDFNGNALNRSNWKFETGCEPNWGNHELQCYTDHGNLRVVDGHLVFEAKVMNGRSFTSARINSQHSWTFGKFEARMRLPGGKNLWPAFWLMPSEDVYGDYPASGEIDIMEGKGEQPDTIESTIHYGGAEPNFVSHGSPPVKFAFDFSKDFHVIGLEWSAKEMKFIVDGKVFHRENLDKDMWSHKGPNPYTKHGQPFDQNFYIILNLAVGGDMFEKPWVTPAEAKHWPKATMEVDWVKVSQWK